MNIRHVHVSATQDDILRQMREAKAAYLSGDQAPLMALLAAYPDNPQIEQWARDVQLAPFEAMRARWLSE